MAFWNKLFNKDNAKKEQPKPKDLIGEVEGFFRKPSVAVIKLKKAGLSKNDHIWIKGHTTDWEWCGDPRHLKL